MPITEQRKAAFFDVDGTLISKKSLVSFAHYLERRGQKPIQFSSIAVFLGNLQEKLQSDATRSDLNRHYFSIYKNIPRSVISLVANEWFSSEEDNDGFYIENSINELRRLQSQGYAIVFVTGSFLPLLESLQQRFNVDDILCTTLECIDDVYTGELIGDPCIGETKRKRVIKYAIENNIDLENSWAFGDDDSDMPMLQSVGTGVRIAPCA